jgi:hypothetical protein
LFFGLSRVVPDAPPGAWGDTEVPAESCRIPVRWQAEAPSFGVLNTPEEVETTLGAIRELA